MLLIEHFVVKMRKNGVSLKDIAKVGVSTDAVSRLYAILIKLAKKQKN